MYHNIKKYVCILMIIVCTANNLFAQNSTITINGYIKDASSQESLIGTPVYETTTKVGTVTNQYGYYSLTLKKSDSLTIIVSYIGYEPQAKKIADVKNLRLDFLLVSKTREMKEVKISSKKNNDNVQRAQMGVIDIPMQAIKTLPILGGERDVLKIVQLLPGVQQGNEGTTGFFVRGGNADQNLIQLDEATVYNPNHLFGLFSTFNVNAINNVKLTKGGFPAQYGGRLSSVLDITMKEGNKTKPQVEGGIGLLASNITIQAPIVKNKSSFIISARRSYADLIAKPFLPKGNKGTTYYLYDLNAKVNYEVNKNNRLFLSLFTGRDKANYTGANSLNYGINFGNSTGTLRWNHLFGNKLFANTSLIANDYHLGLSTTQGLYYALLYTAIRDYTAKTDISYYPNSHHEIKFGASIINHTLFPSSVSAKIPKKGNRITINRDSILQKHSNELALYGADEWKMNDKFSLNYGVRIPIFFTKGKTYTGIEPRATAKFSIDKLTSIKASYTIMNQFLHLVPSSTASLPTDIWIPSSTIVKPQRSTQYALGLFKNFKNNEWETSIEGYYKTMSNQVLFKEGTQVVLNSDLDKVLTFGNGKSYGIELFVKKNVGRLTGWGSYTLSKTTQQFDSLNYGKVFPFAYDRRHNFSLVAMYNLTKHWTISADFVYYTGNAFTLPAGKIPVYTGGNLYDNIYLDYTSRNNSRMRAYNRLDISATNKKEVKLFHKKYEREWAFSLYNVYSRRNPYFVYLSTDPMTKTPTATQVSLLPIIPSINFNFKF